MNVGELRALLQDLPDDMEVSVVTLDVRTEVTQTTTSAEVAYVDGGYVTRSAESARAEQKFLIHVWR